MMRSTSMNSAGTVQVNYPLAIVAIFLWIGFVCAISFMEAWLKFQAPGITLALGLGIGRLVFDALNKVEWVLALSILVNILFMQQLKGLRLILLLLPVILLFVQTVWLLPVLDARAQQVLDNEPLMPSNVHFYYVGFELLKVSSLVILGISLFKKV